jgi:hypothetical protein
MIRTPLVIQAYIRPEETIKILNSAKKADVSKIYLFVDHPKTNDINLINLNNQVLELENLVDWDCDFTMITFKRNYGVWAGYNEIMKQVFEIEDSCIFLEDDKIPSPSFFTFCDELLDRFRYDERILFVSGLNGKRVYPSNYNYDYFYAKGNTPWGHALWKRTYLKFRDALEFYNYDYYRDLVCNYYNENHDKYNILAEVNSYLKTGRYRGHVPSNEFYMLVGPTRILNSGLVIVPTKNLISDHGATHNSVHGDAINLLPKRVRSWYFRETYDLNFPLNHPPYMIPDLKYYGQKSTVYRKLINRYLNIIDKLERVYLIIIHRGISGLIYKLKMRIKQFLNKEY